MKQTITLAGKKYEVKFTTGAMAYVERETGEPFSEIARAAQAGRVSLLSLVALLTAGIRFGMPKERRHAAPSFDDVCELIDESGGIAAVAPMIAKAWKADAGEGADMPADSTDDPENPTQAPAGDSTGKP